MTSSPRDRQPHARHAEKVAAAGKAEQPEQCHDAEFDERMELVEAALADKKPGEQTEHGRPHRHERPAENRGVVAKQQRLPGHRVASLPQPYAATPARCRIRRPDDKAAEHERFVKDMRTVKRLIDGLEHQVSEKPCPWYHSRLRDEWLTIPSSGKGGRRPADDIIVNDPEILGGRSVFRGPRVPIGILFDNLADGMTVDEILGEYPTLNREDVLKLLRQATHALSPEKALLPIKPFR